MAVKLIYNDLPAFLDSSGNPLNGGKLYTYAAGSTTLQTTYTTSAGDVAQANPIVLNSRGEPANAIWGTVGQTYKLVLKTSADVTIWTIDNVSPINDSSTTNDQWTAGPAPTYIGATSFSLVGDQTSTFMVGRRLKTTNSGGTIYSTITVSAYTTLTTLTVVNDSGTLDSGLSVVSYALLSATNFSIPKLTAANKRLIDLPGLADTNTFTSTQTLSGAALDEALSTVASATTPDIWAAAVGNVINYTGTATATGFAAAPQAGARRTLVCAGAAVFTAGANMLIDGVASASNFTAAAGDKVHVIAVTTTQFRLTPAKADGTAVTVATVAFIQRKEGTPYTTYASSTAAFPNDDTIPQNNEGTEIINNCTITPTSATNRLKIYVQISCLSTNDINSPLAAGIFQDAVANALATGSTNIATTLSPGSLLFTHEMAAGTTLAITFKLRWGASIAGTSYINGNSTTRIYGSVCAARMWVEEIVP